MKSVKRCLSIEKEKSVWDSEGLSPETKKRLLELEEEVFKEKPPLISLLEDLGPSEVEKELSKSAPC